MTSERSPLLEVKISGKHRTFSAIDEAVSENGERKLESPDDALLLAGNPGRFHYFQLFALCIQFVPLVMSDLIPIFYNLPPQHIYCVQGDSRNGSNYRPDIPHNVEYPKGGNVTGDYCNCNGTLDFVYQEQQTSIIGAMELICRKSALPDLATTLYYVVLLNTRPTANLMHGHLVASFVFSALALMPVSSSFCCWHTALRPKWFGRWSFLCSASRVRAMQCKEKSSESGSAVAGPICGWLSDHYGRRPVILLASVAFIGIHVSLILVRNFVLFAVLRFLAGVGRVGVFSTAYVLVMEWTLPSRRTVVAAASEFFFPAGVILLAACADILRKWEYIQLFLAACTGIAVLNIWFAPESLQWLLVNQKSRKAAETLRQICSLNGRTLSAESELVLDQISQKAAREQASAMRYTVWDCFRIRKIRTYTLLISFVWFATNFGYSGLSFLIDNFSDNIYKDLMIGGALELLPCLLATLIALKSGKKYPMMVFFIVAGVMTITGGLIASQRTKVILALLGRMSLVGSYCLMFLYAAELFPTEIRNSGFGVGFLFFMAGGMLSPQLSLLTRVVFPGLPLVIIGGVSLLGAVAVSVLPESTDPSVLHVS